MGSGHRGPLATSVSVQLISSRFGERENVSYILHPISDKTWNSSRLTVRATDAVVLALAWSGWRTTGVETVVGWAAVGLSGQA